MVLQASISYKSLVLESNSPALCDDDNPLVLDGFIKSCY